jgi:bacillopeptidase F (M6 metalloprotease family)
VGSGAYTGSREFAWVPATIDLGSYVGQNVQLRWLYRTDSSTVGAGWFIDDIAISHAQVPGACSARPPGRFCAPWRGGSCP